MSKNILAPIVLFVYNRLWHTQQTVEALKANKLAEESMLCIYSDGPKNESDLAKVSEMRKYLKTITGFKSLTIVERDKNYGLSRSIITGVTEIVNKYDKIIVLEDDLITSPFFLTYMNASLNYYKNEKQVVQVTGYMYPMKVKTEYDNLLLPLTSSWGWGTWKRAWKYFDIKAKGWEKLFSVNELKNRFDFGGSYPFSEMLRYQMQGKIDSWAIRWYWTVFKANGLIAYPKSSYIINIGMDGSGVNCGDDYGWNNKKISRKNIHDLDNYNFQSDICSSEFVFPDVKNFFSKLYGCFK